MTLAVPVKSPFPLPHQRADGYFTDFRATKMGVSPPGWTPSANLQVTADGLDVSAMDAIYSGMSIQNGEWEIEGKINNGALGFFVRTDASAQNCYMINLDAVNSLLKFHKRVATAYTVLVSVPCAFSINTIYRVNWTFVGSRHIISINGKQLLDYSDTTFLNSGYIGLRQSVTSSERGIIRYMRCGRQ